MRAVWGEADAMQVMDWQTPVAAALSVHRPGRSAHAGRTISLPDDQLCSSAA